MFWLFKEKRKVQYWLQACKHKKARAHILGAGLFVGRPEPLKRGRKKNSTTAPFFVPARYNA
jgi:hypothetical protein